MHGDTEAAKDSRLAALALFLLILAVCIGPRVRLEGIAVESQDVDIRWQDILLFPGMLLLMLLRRPRMPSPMLRLFGFWLPLFMWSVLLLLSLHLLINPEVSLLRRVAFTGRTLELFVLALVVAGLYAHAGTLAMSAALRAVHLSALVNITWVGYQYITGDVGTLLGSEVGSLIDSYGPMLVGEASAFGTGQYFAFVAAVGVAEFRSRVQPRPIAITMIGIALAGATLSESRISMGAVLLMIAMLVVVSTSRRRLFNPAGMVAASLIGGLAAAVVGPRLDGRLSLEKIEAGWNVRVTEIWRPLIDYVIANPFIGVGPGGLVPSLPRDEAHNIYLRAMLDFGVLFGILFIGMFVFVMVRSQRAAVLSANPQVQMFGNLAFLTTASVLFSGFAQDALTGVMSAHLTMIGVGLFAATYASFESSIANSERRIKHRGDDSEVDESNEFFPTYRRPEHSPSG